MKDEIRSKVLALWMNGMFIAGMVLIAGSVPAQEAERQVLVNPDFSLPATGGNPPGWFRAMIPAQTQNLDAGLATDEFGAFIYLEQRGVSTNLYNNWAQRFEHPPAGAKFRFEATVAVENAPEGAFIAVGLFTAADNMIGNITPAEKIAGTTPLRTVTVEGTIPDDCALAIVRIGLNPGGGRIIARSAKLFLSGGTAPDSASTAPAPTAGMELLRNGDFSQVQPNGDPLYWFRAMLPNMATGLDAGVEKIGDREAAVYLRQDGVKGNVLNNWGQRIDVVPVGARVRFRVDVKTENVPENTGVVMVQCWNTKSSPDGTLLAAATSQSTQPIGGTMDWKTVELELTVPEQTDLVIVRLGMTQSGKIWFDRARFNVISAPRADSFPEGAPSEAVTAGAGGFEVTEASLAQLQQVRAMASELEAVARQKLPDGARVSHSVFASGGGEYEVTIHFKFE